jgi:beta propeller repeat protein
LTKSLFVGSIKLKEFGGLFMRKFYPFKTREILRKYAFFAVIGFGVLALAGEREARADLPELPVCIGSYDKFQPFVSGNIIVWTDCRNKNWDIYGYDIKNKKEFPICNNYEYQCDPSVYGNIVVWTDYRNREGSETDIYGADINDVNNIKEFPICTNSAPQCTPRIFKNIIVWKDCRKGELDTDIYGYIIATKVEFPICVSSGNQVWPYIFDNKVVWRDNRKGNEFDSDIYGCEIDPNTGDIKKEFPVCNNSAYQDYPSIYKDIVVWWDNRNGNGDIYGADINDVNNIKEFPICTNVRGQGVPNISGNVVVWVDLKKRDFDHDIYGYNLDNRREFKICTNSAWQLRPSVSADIVVWEDDRTGRGDIYMAKIPERVKTLTADFNDDEIVNFQDLAEFVEQWLAAEP